MSLRCKIDGLPIWACHNPSHKRGASLARTAGKDCAPLTGYVAPVARRTALGKTVIEISDLNHPEAIGDLIYLLKEVGRGESVRIRIAT